LTKWPWRIWIALIKVLKELFTTVVTKLRDPRRFVIAFPFDLVLRVTVTATGVPNGLNIILVLVCIAHCYDRTRGLRNLAWKYVRAAWLDEAHMKFVLDLHSLWQLKLDIERFLT
jgi:small basic protein